jgi:type I restriction enzyme S subunit
MRSVKLEEVCSFTRGLTYGKSDEVDFSSNIVLRANNIDLDSNSINLNDLRYIKDSIRIKPEKIVKKNSLIICTASGSKSHVGKVALIDKDYGYAFGGFMGQITPSEDCYPKFLYYVLTSGLFKDFLMSLNDGTNINNLKFSDIANYQFVLPTLETQRKIVETLDNAFNEIDLMERNLCSSDEKASQLIQSLLYLAFSSSKANDELSDSPADQGLTAKVGFPMVRLGDLCNTISGLWTGKKPPFEKATVIRNTNFTKDCNLDLSNVAVLDVETKQLKSRTLLPGDLIIEKSGGGPKQAVGRVVHFNETSGTYSLSNFTSALRVKDSSEVLPLYLRHFLYFQYTSGETENMQSHSTGIRNLNMHQFLDVRVPLPSLEKQREIVEVLDKVFSEIEYLKVNIKFEKDSAAALRQSLLSSAISEEKVVA